MVGPFKGEAMGPLGRQAHPRAVVLGRSRNAIATGDSRTIKPKPFGAVASRDLPVQFMRVHEIGKE